MVGKEESTSMSMSTGPTSTATFSVITTDTTSATQSSSSSSTPSSTSSSPSTQMSTSTSISISTVPTLTPSSTSISSLPTTSSSSITLLPPSSSSIPSTTTTPPATTSTILSLPSSSTLTTASSTSSPPANITIVHAPTHNNTPVLVGITVGSSIAIILLLAITGTWYSHVRSRNKARREEEHEIATNPQGTFIGGYKLRQLRSQELSEQQPTLPNFDFGGEKTGAEDIAKSVGVRRSNTREDGRRNGVMLQVTNPDPALGALHIQSHGQTFAAGEHNRARFDAWKRARGLHQHTSGAATQYHRSSFSEALSSQTPLHITAQKTPVSIQNDLITRVQPETNIEIISTGVKRMRSKLDTWKTGEVSPIAIIVPDLQVTAATPRKDTFESGKGWGEGKELKTFLLSGERPVSKGPATFEAMGLKESKKGLLGVERTPRSVEDK